MFIESLCMRHGLTLCAIVLSTKLWQDFDFFCMCLQQSALARYASSFEGKGSSVNLDVPSLKSGVKHLLNIILPTSLKLEVLSYINGDTHYHFQVILTLISKSLNTKYRKFSLYFELIWRASGDQWIVYCCPALRYLHVSISDYFILAIFCL